MMHKKFWNVMKRRNKRLAELGYRDHDHYTTSDHWKARRAAYAEAHPPVCGHCGQPADALHHVSYENVGDEKDEDLQWLCFDHHHELHEWGEIKPATDKQRQRLLTYGFTGDQIDLTTRGVAFRLIDDIFHARRKAPNELPPVRPGVTSAVAKSVR